MLSVCFVVAINCVFVIESLLESNVTAGNKSVYEAESGLHSTRHPQVPECSKFAISRVKNVDFINCLKFDLYFAVL